MFEFWFVEHLRSLGAKCLVLAPEFSTKGQFHQHLWHQSRAAFAQLIFVDLKWQKLLTKMCQNMALDAKAVV